MPIFQKENDKALRVETTTSEVIEIAKLKEEKRVLLIRTDMETERHNKFMEDINSQLLKIDTLLIEAEKVGIDIVNIEPVSVEFIK